MRSDTSSKVRPGGNAKVLDKHVKEYIKSELSHREGGFIPGYPVIDFVRNVWGFTPESIPRGQTGYKLDALLVYAYETSEYTKGKQYTSYERTSCAAFEDIFNGLADLVETNQKEVAPLSQSAEFNSKLYFLRERVLDGDYAGFKPDYASTKKGALDDRRKKLHWERAGIVGEQKKHVPKEMEEVPLQGEIIIDPGLLLPNEGASSVLNDVQPQHLRRVEKRSAKNRANKTDQGRSTPLQPVVIAEEKVSAPAQGVNSGEEPMLVSEAQTGQPRNVSKDGLPDGVDQIPLAEAEPVDPASWTNPSPATAEISKLEAGEPGKLRDEEVQITKYLGELLAHGIRQYASGFLVEDQWITLWSRTIFSLSSLLSSLLHGNNLGFPLSSTLTLQHQNRTRIPRQSSAFQGTRT
ncbi:hypothetical protein K474DRAFT_484836 [Panus rudis PR-1116 ss-1]|nr:hypothetical protein K474DRAFT_484836 [Panus rudis PR-1116 ss-1]